MRGQNIEIGRDQGIAIGIGILAVVLIAGFLLSGGGPGDEGPTINTTAETDGQATKIPYGFRVTSGDYVENVELVGAYAGHPFQSRYPNNQTDPVKMRITDDIQPGDGIIDVWMTGRIVNASTDPAFVADVFVDDDFRDAVPGATLAWGPSFTENVRPYTFAEYQSGIYRDTVVDRNTTRFRGGDGGANVAVGNFTVDIIGSEQLVRDRGITVVSAR